MNTQQNRRRPASAERAVALPVPDAGFHSGFYLPLKDVVLGDADDAQVIANGNLVVSWLDSTFDGTVDAYGELQTVDAGVGLNGAVTIELAVDRGGELAGSLRLAMIPLPPFTVGSVTVSPYVQVKLHLEGTADAGARVSVVAPFRISGRFTNPGPPDQSPRPRYEPEVGPPDAAQGIGMTGRIELEVVVAFLLAIEGIPVGGPVIGTSLGVIVKIDTDPAAPAWWDVDGLVKVVGGWAFLDPTTLLPDIPEELEVIFEPDRWNIDSADGPLPVIGTESSRWSQVYDIAGDDEAVAAVAVENGLIVLETDTRGGDLNHWLASLDGLGVPRWQQLLTGNSITPKAMVSATDGDLVIAGQSGNVVFIDRYAPSGAPRWRRILSVPAAMRVTCNAMVPTALNGIVIAGEVTHPGAVPAPIVAAVDDAGDVEWVTEIDTGAGSTSPTIQAIAETPAGEILAVGKVDYTDTVDPFEATIYRDNALIMRLSADGDTLAAYAVGGRGYESGLRIAVHEDGSYAIGGHLDSALPVWIASFAADDTLQWSYAYQSRPNDAYGDPTALAPLAGNGLVISGHSGSGDDVVAWLMRVDRRGMPIWLKSYESADVDELSGVVPVPGGLFAFGSTGITEETTVYSDIWVLRTSVDGMARFTADSGLKTDNTAVQWQDRRPDHVVHALAPSNIATTLDGGPVVIPPQFTVDPANAVGEVITE